MSLLGRDLVVVLDMLLVAIVQLGLHFSVYLSSRRNVVGTILKRKGHPRWADLLRRNEDERIGHSLGYLNQLKL